MRAVMLLLVALVLAPLLLAAGDVNGHQGDEWLVPGALSGLAGVVVWGARLVAKTIERTASQTDAHIARLCAVADSSIQSSKDSAKAMDDARRSFEQSKACRYREPQLTDG